MNDVTKILNELDVGKRQNAARLLPLVYEELHRLANRKMAQEAAWQTLSATGLVHESFMRLAVGGDVPRWESRVHFFRAAAEAMRRILIDRARKNRRLSGVLIANELNWTTQRWLRIRTLFICWN